MPVAVSRCRDCGREMITYTHYRRDPVLREKYALKGAWGMCFACYRRAHVHGTVPNPAPRKITPGQIGDLCRGCDEPMASYLTLRKRPELRATHVRRNAHGMCFACYRRARRLGTLPNPAPPQAGPLDPGELARLRAAVGLTERHAPGEVNA